MTLPLPAASYDYKRSGLNAKFGFQVDPGENKRNKEKPPERMCAPAAPLIF